MPSKLGDRLTALRDERGLTNDDLAQAAGIEVSTISQILAGEIERPPDSRLRGLARLLDVSFDELLGLVPADRRDEDEGEDDARTALAATATELDAQPPEWVQLMPAGEVRTRAHDGREAWHLRNLNGVVAATRAIGLPLVIDYEHQTEHARANGQPAPAAGWIDEVEARPDGVWGRAAWTDRARAMIASREYRFLSPVFRFDPASREVRRIVMAGLTNDRALADIKALAKSEGSMNELRKKLAHSLGLAEDADEAAIASAVTRMVEQAKARGDASAGPGAGEAAAQALARVAAALGLEASANAQAVEQAAAKAAAAAAGTGELGELKTELAALKAERAEEKAAARVDAAMAEGKIVPAQRDWAVGYAKRDPQGFEAFVGAQPQIVKGGGGQAGGKPPKRSDGALDADERAVARAMGVTEEEYRASARAIAEREQEAR